MPLTVKDHDKEFAEALNKFLALGKNMQRTLEDGSEEKNRPMWQDFVKHNFMKCWPENAEKIMEAAQKWLDADKATGVKSEMEKLGIDKL